VFFDPDAKRRNRQVPDTRPPKSRKLSPISVSRTSRVMRCCERSSGFFPRVVIAIAEQTIAYSVPAVWRACPPRTLALVTAVSRPGRVRRAP
jgi:hypothetical protein